ncbi:MCE family protein [Williamsia soli]|uniref:MCE family protein n=1 Tax=Williamsia soli TaxID=364929 RepID=UPI001A9F6014|nr:MCE family protein [Williamsia soli]
MRASKTVAKVVVLVVLIAAVCFGSVRAATASEGSIRVTAQFDNGVGLYEGNSVSVLGMPVGKVETISPKGTYVEVVMSIEGGVTIPAGVDAVTVSTSILTDRHIELSPAYTGGPVLKNNDFIGLDRTKTPVEFDRLLAMADDLAIELEGDGEGAGPVAELLDVGSAITDGNGQDMRAALGELAKALRLGADGGAETRDAITTIVDNLSVLTEAAARNDGQIRDFGSAVSQLSGILADQDLGSGDTGAQINEILLQAEDLLRTNQGNLNSTVTDSNVLVKTLADYRRELAEFLDVTPLLLDNAYAAVDQENRVARVHAQLDKVFFDGQLLKEVCNVLGLRQLGCATGTLSDFGPDFGITDMLEGMAGLAK